MTTTNIILVLIWLRLFMMEGAFKDIEYELNKIAQEIHNKN